MIQRTANFFETKQQTKKKKKEDVITELDLASHVLIETFAASVVNILSLLAYKFKFSDILQILETLVLLEAQLKQILKDRRTAKRTTVFIFYPRSETFKRAVHVLSDVTAVGRVLSLQLATGPRDIADDVYIRLSSSRVLLLNH